MKLKNKQTGEIINNNGINFVEGNHKTYNSLAELNEEWEDYEELKDIWWLDNEGNVNHATSEVNDSFEKNRQIGNYFETKEEAELAVRKLKAWKRLKDKGFKFDKWFTRVEGGIQINMDYPKYDGIHAEDKSDLDLLFGGEE